MSKLTCNKFDYYYGKEAEQFNFYRIPKLLFIDERFKGVSTEAKVLYGLLLDRMSLSIKNGWFDDENRVYIYFTLEEAMEFLSIGKDKGIKLFAELDDKKGCGLIKRRTQGFGKPMIIYVMNFNSVIVPNDEETRENSDNFQTSEKPKSRVLKNRSHVFGKSEVNETNISNNISDNNLITSNQDRECSTKLDVKNEIIMREKCKKDIAKNIEYALVCENYSQEKADSVLDIILDAVCSKKDYLMIAGGEIPQIVVKNRFLKLDYRHIEYVLDCLENNTSKIYNIQSYILTALYNSPKTMEHYYTTLVRHDLCVDK